MIEPSLEQVRSFRLRSHHLDRAYTIEDAEKLAGACGMQNSPPGAWETAFFHRAPSCTRTDLESLLYQKRTLLQAWSFRGAPVVFPASENAVFLHALTAQEYEPWIYTQGIGLALDFLQIDFEELHSLLKEVISELNGVSIVSKASLDQFLADQMTSRLPAAKQALWNQPSMYGNPDKQTVGGAAVSFLLRPCSFEGLVVFGERKGISPSFTSFQTWTGRSPEKDPEAAKKLVRKFLHSYGPSTRDAFVRWLGCSPQQGKRLWQAAAEETEPVSVSGKKAFLLSEDREALFAPASFSADYLLLGEHDPFLDQRDREILLPDRSLHKQVWRLVSNPGAVLYRGEIIGIWNSRKKGKGLEILFSLWRSPDNPQKLRDLAEQYAAFRELPLAAIQL
jgi:hypothetical protein